MVEKVDYEEEGVVARKLVEEIMTMRKERAHHNAEIRRIKKEEDEAEKELMELLKAKPAGSQSITLDRKVEKVLIVGIGERSGGGHFVEAWSKPIVAYAKDAKHANNLGLD
jgi:hypothetical protein